MAEYDAEASSDPLYVLRHSTAHLLAAAVTQLLPGTKYAGGPPVENGFYYDFDLPQPLGEDDLPRIEKKMRELSNQKIPFQQQLVPHQEAVRIFEELDQAFKLMRVAGAYWLGDEKNKQLTRIYGTAWPSKADLESYLLLLAEAEKRDHKRL